MRRTLLLASILALSWLGTARAGVIVNAIDHGWWDDSGLHIEGNLNTITGRDAAIPPPTDYNSFFVFDLSGVSGIVTSAVLRLQQTTYQSVDASEPYAVYDVETPIDALRATGFGQTSIFLDLQSGNVYGTDTADAGTVDTIRSIVLSSAAIGDLDAALGGLFAVGVHLTDLAGPTDQHFHFANDLVEVSQLDLTVEPGQPIPEPGNVALLTVGLAGIVLRRRRL